MPGFGTGGDHSFTLQTIMELQRSTGEMAQALRSLEKSVEKFDARLDGIEKELTGVTRKIYAAGVVLTILVAIGAFIVNKAWDLMAKTIVEQAHASAPSPAPASVAAPPAATPKK